jgi:hypothetical protein
MTKTYQKEYKQSYKQKNKIVTFPLSNIFYEQLRKKSIYYDLTVNSYTKTIVTNFLNSDTSGLLSTDRANYIQEYIRISRGIATNINQIAHKTNMEDYIDINILIRSLQHYEEEFKKFISKQ